MHGTGAHLSSHGQCSRALLSPQHRLLFPAGWESASTQGKNETWLEKQMEEGKSAI